MPLFFFNLNKHVSVPDQEGVELPDLVTAEAYALEDARELAADHVRNGKLNLSDGVEIADNEGHVLRTIRFADAIEIAS